MEVPTLTIFRRERPLLAVGVAAVIAESRSFAAIGQWAADAGSEVLAMLGGGPRAGGGVNLSARVRPGQR